MAGIPKTKIYNARPCGNECTLLHQLYFRTVFVVCHCLPSSRGGLREGPDCQLPYEITLLGRFLTGSGVKSVFDFFISDLDSGPYFRFLMYSVP